MDWTPIDMTPRTIRIPGKLEPALPQNVAIRDWPNSMGTTPRDAVGKQVRVSDGGRDIYCVVSGVDDRGRLMLSRLGEWS